MGVLLILLIQLYPSNYCSSREPHRSPLTQQAGSSARTSGPKITALTARASNNPNKSYYDYYYHLYIFINNVVFDSGLVIYTRYRTQFGVTPLLISPSHKSPQYIIRFYSIVVCSRHLTLTTTLRCTLAIHYRL